MARRNANTAKDAAADTAENTGTEATEINGAEHNAETAAAPATRRRAPRRKTGPRKGAGKSETATVVDALLRTRGPRGASQEDLETVVTWAERTRAEGEALLAATDGRRRGAKSARGRAAGTRARQLTEEELKIRRSRHEMDRALLEGVLSGKIALDVRSGQILFLSEQFTGQYLQAQPASAPASETVDL